MAGSKTFKSTHFFFWGVSMPCEVNHHLEEWWFLSGDDKPLKNGTSLNQPMKNAWTSSQNILVLTKNPLLPRYLMSRFYRPAEVILGCECAGFRFKGRFHR